MQTQKSSRILILYFVEENVLHTMKKCISEMQQRQQIKANL